jgi:hypothetical protein
MPIEDTYSPILHRINQAIKRRAVRPDEPVQPPAEILIKYSYPPEELVKNSETQLSKLVAAANIKKGTYRPTVDNTITNSVQYLPKPRESAAEISSSLYLALMLMHFSAVKSVPRLRPTMRSLNSSRCSKLLKISVSLKKRQNKCLPLFGRL